MSWMVFKSPGPSRIHGHDVEFKVIDEAQREEHLAAGWFDTAIEAGQAWLKAKEDEAKKVIEEVEDKAAATRDEIIQKLEELGVVFDRRLGISKLAALVEKTLKERG